MLSLHYTYLGDVILARELLDLGEGDKNATGKKLLLHFILLHWQIDCKVTNNVDFKTMET